MTTDISRQTFDRTRHYSQVVMQQGRVQLDADWNEQQEMLQYRLETQTKDMVGQSGVPSADGGFKVSFTPGGGDLLISPGRMYVDGILCEVDKATPVKVLGLHGDNGVAVKNLIVDGLAWEKGQWVELLNEHHRPVRHFQISAVTQEKETGLLILTFNTDQENPGIKVDQRESIEEVRRVITYTTQPNYPDPQFTTKSSSGLPRLDLPSGQPLLLAYLEVWRRHITALEDERIREVALDGPDTSARIQTAWRVIILPCPLSSELERLLTKDAELGSELGGLESVGPTAPESRTAHRIRENRAEQEQLTYEITRYLSIYRPDAWEDLQKIPTGQLNVTTYNADKTQSSGYSGLQNQLYRVEIHKVSADSNPVIFKWSHDNASVASLVEVRGDTVIVPGTGQGGILSYSRGQFVEVVSDRSELNGEPGKLLQITRVDTLTNRLTLDSSAGSDGAHIKIRLWDGKGEAGEQPTWIPLDGGIKIQFSRGTYKNGDFWLIPARTSTKEVEWPPYQVPNTHPLPQTRRGTQHHYSRLAFIRLHQRENRTVCDCRRRFTPLPTAIDAMHIIGINWDNDEIYRHRDLERGGRLKAGLEIHLDARLDEAYVERIAAAMIVTIETETLGGGKELTVINGRFGLKNDGHTITWSWHEDDILPWFRRLLSSIFNDMRHPVRVRVTLIGSTIWSRRGNEFIYLDGQAFGIPGHQADNRPRIHLTLPSGGGLKASDFESWFYIRE